MVDELLGDRPPAGSLYTPVLRAKASEWKALSDLPFGIRARVRPIVEFIADWNEPGAKPRVRKARSPQTAPAYLTRFFERCLASTPPGTNIFCDFGHVGTSGEWKNLDVWDAFAEACPVPSGVIPMAGLKALEGRGKLTRVVRTYGTLGVRVTIEDLNPTLASRLDGVLRVCRLTPDLVHVAVDLKDAPRAATHSQIRAGLGHTEDYASVTVLAGVFPQDLTGYQPGVSVEPRTEWMSWWTERLKTAHHQRLLSFGDYTTQSAHYQVSPGVPGSVSLRYTTDRAIVIFRGRQPNSRAGLGFEQMHGHCRMLVNRPDYAGAAFSWGDQRIRCWTDPAHGTGNAEQWRRASIGHHITHVVVQTQDPGGATESARTWARRQPSAPCSK